MAPRAGTKINVAVPDHILEQIEESKGNMTRTRWINEAIAAHLRRGVKRRASPPIERAHVHDYKELVGTRFANGTKTKMFRCMCGETEERNA